MGFIKGGLFVIVTVLFFISLLLMNSLLVVSLSLDYDNIKTELVPVVKDTLKENINVSSIIAFEKYPLMQQYCENLSATGEYVFNIEGYTFVVPCSSLSNGVEAVVDSAIDNFVYEQYYKQYDCNFWNCLKGEGIPLVIVSEHSQDYWQAKFYYLLLSSIILLALMFLLIEKKTNLPLVAGPIVILSSLLFAKLEALTKWLVNTFVKIPFSSEITPDSFFNFFNLIFVQSSKVFWIMFIIGIVLLAAGIILKFFTIGFKINEFFSKFSSKGEEPQPEKQAVKDKSSKGKKR